MRHRGPAVGEREDGEKKLRSVLEADAGHLVRRRFFGPGFPCLQGRGEGLVESGNKRPRLGEDVNDPPRLAHQRIGGREGGVLGGQEEAA